MSVNDINTFGIFILRYLVIVTFAIFRARKIFFIAESSQTLSKTSLTVNLLITGQQLTERYTQKTLENTLLEKPRWPPALVKIM